MKMISLATTILLACPAFASSQLICNISEDVNPPLQSRSKDFVVSMPLSAKDQHAGVELASTSLGLSYTIHTFLSQLTSPGQQVILIYIKDHRDNKGLTTDGHGFAYTDFETENGSLHIQCSVGP